MRIIYTKERVESRDWGKQIGGSIYSVDKAGIQEQKPNFNQKIKRYDL